MRQRVSAKNKREKLNMIIKMNRDKIDRIGEEVEELDKEALEIHRKISLLL